MSIELSGVKINKEFKGYRIIEALDENLLLSKNYSLYSYSLETGRITLLTKINNWKYSFLSKIRLLSRLFRAEITKSYTLHDGSLLIIAKKGIYKWKPGSNCRKVFEVERGSRPLNLCISKDNSIYFGEYFNNTEKKEVHIYKSTDLGERWEIAFTFPKNTINHIHGIFMDPFDGSIWVCTGDLGNECLIGRTTDGFKNFEILFKGNQKYRTTHLFFYQDFILYATDSQYILNHIIKIQRNSLKVENVMALQGSVIKAGQCGSLSFLSTTVEPSKVNLDKCSHLWYTKDGNTWVDLLCAKKDKWPSVFQYGCIEFPNNSTTNERMIHFYGRALKGIGNNSYSIHIQ